MNAANENVDGDNGHGNIFEGWAVFIMKTRMKFKYFIVNLIE